MEVVVEVFKWLLTGLGVAVIVGWIFAFYKYHYKPTQYWEKIHREESKRRFTKATAEEAEIDSLKKPLPRKHVYRRRVAK